MLEILRLSIGLTQADLKARHAHSLLGIFWYFLGPLLTFMVLLLAFRTSLGTTIPHYPLYLALGIIIFQTVQEISLDASRKLFDHRQLLKSFYLPPSALILSIFLRVFIFQGIHLLLLVGVAVWIQLSIWNLLWYPLLLIIVMGFSFGMTLGIFLLGAVIADLNNLLLFAYRLLWLATPIFYDVSAMGSFLSRFNHFNPFFHLLVFGRNLIVYNHISYDSLAILLLFSLSTAVLSLWYGKVSYQKVMHRL